MQKKAEIVPQAVMISRRKFPGEAIPESNLLCCNNLFIFNILRDFQTLVRQVISSPLAFAMPVR